MVTPGRTVSAALRLRNPTNHPLQVLLAPVDAATGARGGVTYELADHPANRVGSWISLPGPSVVLGPGGVQQVGVEVGVPAGVAAGQHLGGIAAWVPGHDDQTDASKHLASVGLQTRRVVALEVIVTGVVPPELAITGVSPAPRPDGMQLAIGIENRGGGLSPAADGIIKIPALRLTLPIRLDSVVPDAPPLAYVARSGALPRGTFDAQVELRYGSQIARWLGQFTVGQADVDRLADRNATGTIPTRQSDRSPWWISLVVAAGTALAVSGLVRATRGRRRNR
jgi:hypothetical protein